MKWYITSVYYAIFYIVDLAGRRDKKSLKIPKGYSKAVN